MGVEMTEAELEAERAYCLEINRRINAGAKPKDLGCSDAETIVDLILFVNRRLENIEQLEWFKQDTDERLLELGISIKSCQLQRRVPLSTPLKLVETA